MKPSDAAENDITDQAVTRACYRSAGPGAHLHPPPGAAAPLRRQLYPFRQRRPHALARFRSGGAVQRQLLHGLHCSCSPGCSSTTAWRGRDLWTICPPRMAAGRALSRRDLRADADRLLSDLPALPSAGTTDFNFFHFWWRVLTVGPWPSGPVWFLWVLLAFDAIAGRRLGCRARALKDSGISSTGCATPAQRSPFSACSRSRFICRCG